MKTLNLPPIYDIYPLVHLRDHVAGLTNEHEYMMLFEIDLPGDDYVHEVYDLDKLNSTHLTEDESELVSELSTLGIRLFYFSEDV